MKMKLHTPSWHSGGRKFKLGNYSSLSFGLDDKARPRVRWRSGLRERHKPEAASASPVRFRSIGSLVRPSSSARQLVASGNYKNPLRSTVYG